MSNKIEKIVRHYVNKVLSEAVHKMDAVIDKKVNERVQQRLDLATLLEQPISAPRTLKETVGVPEVPLPFAAQVPHIPKSAPPSAPSPSSILDKFRDHDENPYGDVFADTAQSGNPLLRENFDPLAKPSPAEQELVPEHILEQAGFLKDFSKHMDAFEDMDRKKVESSDPEAEIEYKKTLQRIHGR